MDEAYYARLEQIRESDYEEGSWQYQFSICSSEGTVVGSSVVKRNSAVPQTHGHPVFENMRREALHIFKTKRLLDIENGVFDTHASVCPSKIEDTLEKRGTVHGDFSNQCAITNFLKQVMRDTNNWYSLRPSQQEALDMIATKIGRILEGDPEHLDHWHDIAGYATLAEKDCAEQKDPKQTELPL